MDGKRKKVHWNLNGGSHGITKMGSSEMLESRLGSSAETAKGSYKPGNI